MCLVWFFFGCSILVGAQCNVFSGITWSHLQTVQSKGGCGAAGGTGQRAQKPPHYRHPAALVACHQHPRTALPAQTISITNPTPTLKERVLIGFSPQRYQYVYFCQ